MAISRYRRHLGIGNVKVLTTSRQCCNIKVQGNSGNEPPPLLRHLLPVQNIPPPPPQRYAQMAATEGVDNADLVGVVTWDLVRLNRNGFRANPNGTGISGLVDANSFFNPECGAPPLDAGGSVRGDDSEDILDRVFTTRYMEVSMISPPLFMQHFFLFLCLYVRVRTCI